MVIPSITIMVKLKTIAFKVTKEQESAIRRMAEARNSSVSELIRDAVFSLETKPGTDFWKHLGDLRQRIAAQNKGKQPVNFKELINQGRKY